jgi:hypothetical protein
LKAKVASVKKIYTKSLSARYPEVKGYPRILDIYALVHSASVMWFEQQMWGMHDMVDTCIQDYFLGTCLHWLIERINKEQARQDVSSRSDHSR